MAQTSDTGTMVISTEEVRQKLSKLEAFIDRANRRIAGHRRTTEKLDEPVILGKKLVERALRIRILEN